MSFSILTIKDNFGTANHIRAMKRIKKSDPSYLIQTKKLLPSTDTFHDQRGPLIWITRKHLERIEQQLQRYEDIKQKKFTIHLQKTFSLKTSKKS